MASVSDFDEVKVTQVATRLLELAGGRMPYFCLIKMMYFADREALLRWGFPITNDRYFSLQHGPVLSHVKDLIDDPRQGDFWAAHISATDEYDVKLLKGAGSGELSRDEEALIGEVFSTYEGKSYWQIRNLSHELPEWKDPAGSSSEISIADILSLNNFGSKAEVEAALEDLAGFRAMRKLSLT